jgi:hypothetical protein
LAHVVHMVLVCWVIVSEEIHSLLASDIFILPSGLPTTTIHPPTTFVRILRLISRSIVALSRKTGLVKRFSIFDLRTTFNLVLRSI